MEKNKLIEEIINNIQNASLSKITFSNFRNKEQELEKVLVTLLLIKNEINVQFEYRYKRILKHNNININLKAALETELENLILDSKDINIQTAVENINIKISKKHKITINRKKAANKIAISTQNKKKNYLLDENNKYEFLVELGIQTKDGKIKKDRYSKFKQINKYLEFIEKSVRKLDNEKEIKILDFGSGKSYLTFAAYHYLVNILNINVKIVGIDLKKEVIDNCNSIAKKLNYSNLEFVYGDVADFTTNDKVDMVISLHACDIATDIALIKSISWQAKVILAVPCCQKEINSQLGVDFSPFILKHGIIKEKFATLLTDSVRSEVLECFGYKSDIIEFISEDNTPKNMLIRATKDNSPIDKIRLEKIENYLKNLGVNMYLISELKNNF